MLITYLTYDYEVTCFEKRCVLGSIDLVKKLFPEKEIELYKDKDEGRSFLCATENFQKKARHFFWPNQLHADTLLGLIEKKSWWKPDPHINIFITSKTLKKAWRTCDFFSRGNTLIISMSRFRKLCFADRKEAIEMCLLRELKHILDEKK